MIARGGSARTHQASLKICSEMKPLLFFIVSMSVLLCKLHALGVVVCSFAALVFWNKTMLWWAGFCAVSTVVWWLIAFVVACIPVDGTRVGPALALGVRSLVKFFGAI